MVLSFFFGRGVGYLVNIFLQKWGKFNKASGLSFPAFPGIIKYPPPAETYLFLRGFSVCNVGVGKWNAQKPRVISSSACTPARKKICQKLIPSGIILCSRFPHTGTLQKDKNCLVSLLKDG